MFGERRSRKTCRLVPCVCDSRELGAWGSKPTHTSLVLGYMWTPTLRGPQVQRVPRVCFPLSCLSRYALSFFFFFWVFVQINNNMRVRNMSLKPFLISTNITHQVESRQNWFNGVIKGRKIGVNCQSSVSRSVDQRCLVDWQHWGCHQPKSSVINPLKRGEWERVELVHIRVALASVVELDTSTWEGKRGHSFFRVQNKHLMLSALFCCYWMIGWYHFASRRMIERWNVDTCARSFDSTFVISSVQSIQIFQSHNQISLRYSKATNDSTCRIFEAIKYVDIRRRREIKRKERERCALLNRI